MALVAESLVAQHEGIQEHKEWDVHGDACLAYLNVSQGEVDAWVDALHPLFESVSAGAL
jgi:hypothetical protein